MQVPPEKKNLTVQEAADMLNVRRERVWKLMNDGVFTAHPSKLDGRQKLIPREQVESLLLEEGYRPRRTASRTKGEAPGAESAREGGSAQPQKRQRLPRTIGVVDDESFQASESEAYMHEHRDREHVQTG